jgi:hypothetical protein
MQLSAKALLKPFCVTASNETDDVEDEGSGVENNMPGLEAFNDEEDDGDPDEEEWEDDDGEKEDPWEVLSDQEKETLLRDTDAVRMTLNKVCLPFLFVLM